MDAITRISRDVADELTEHFDWADDLREAGFHRQATCYELFLDGRIPYDVMVRHFERQRLAGFADRLKKLPGKLRNLVQQQTAKWQQGISNAIKGSATELAALQGIGDEDAAKTKKTLIQKSVEAVAKRVMSDYEESLAAIKDDPKAVEEFVEKLSQGAVKSMASTVGGAAAAFLFAGPAAVGVFLFRKALFNAAKSAIKAGDAKLERVLGEGYTKKKQKVKEVAKEKITSIIRKVFKSSSKAGQGIGLGVGAMALLLKSGLSTKEALGKAGEYLEKKIGKTGAAAVTGVLKGLIIGGVIRGGGGMVGAVAEWFSDEEVAGMIAAPAAAMGGVAEVSAEEAEAAASEMSAQIIAAGDAVKTDEVLLEYIHQVGETSGATETALEGTVTLKADSEDDAIRKTLVKVKGILAEHGKELDLDDVSIEAGEVEGGAYMVNLTLVTEDGEMLVTELDNGWSRTDEAILNDSFSVVRENHTSPGIDIDPD